MNDHDVVLYGSDSAALTHCVVPFIASAVQDGGAAVVIAGEEHERAFRSALAALGIDAQSPSMRERLLFLNANDLIKGLFVDGLLERTRFERLVGKRIRTLRGRYTVHAYGEMVGILRTMDKPADAAQLERLWGDLLEHVPFRLLCGYPIDVLGSEFDPSAMEVILTNHRALISALPNFESSLDAGMESAFGEQRAATIRAMVEATARPGWATLPRTESTLLWLRERMPDDVARVLDGAQNPAGRRSRTTQS